jgi:hypothetical protein
VEKVASDRIEQQVRSAFPEGAIARVQVLQYSDDPEVEPGQTAMRVFFDWPGRSEGKKADPKTVHAFVVANDAPLDMLRHELPSAIRWVEFRPESRPGRPALMVCPTGSQTADGGLRPRMKCWRTSLP